MEKPTLLLHLLLLNALIALMSVHGVVAAAKGTPDGSEQWGYVQVRPKAHMFWWLYRSPHRKTSGSAPWPTVLWLQGGPGASGVGVGNFQEVGPLDTNLKPRNSTWLQLADLLFVDSPVGTGYSFVEDDQLFVKSDVEAATDLTTLLKELYGEIESLRTTTLYIVAESYGGKIAATTGLSVAKAIKAGELKINFGGVALGDSWISPEDYVLSWGPLLKDVSRLDGTGADKSNSLAEEIKQQIAKGQFENATNYWSSLEDVIESKSNNVDFYNFLLDSEMDPLSVTAVELSRQHKSINRYSRYLSSKVSSGPSLGSLMNGVIKEKIKIIPKDVRWGGQSNQVFSVLSGDFMKPRIIEVDELLSLGVNVTIYNGQLDLICATKGTEAWVQKLKWEGLQTFTNTGRTPLFCGNEDGTKGFTKSYRNFHFYWILKAGHFIPVDQPCLALKMLKAITQSPAAAPTIH